jgi:hypothetical protein
VGILLDSSERDSSSTFGREVVMNPTASSSSNGSSEDSEKSSPQARFSPLLNGFETHGFDSLVK